MSTLNPQTAPATLSGPPSQALLGSVFDEMVGPYVAAQLVSAGSITPEQLKHAQRVHARVRSSRTLLSILIELQYVEEPAVRATLRAVRPALPLGSVLVELGYLSEQQLKLALAMQQERPGTPLGEILTENNFAQRDDVFGVLADLRGLVAVEPEQTDLDLELLRLAPLRLYSTHTFLQLRRDPDGVLVAFADPLNQATVEAAREAREAGLPIQLDHAAATSPLAAFLKSA